MNDLNDGKALKCLDNSQLASSGGHCNECTGDVVRVRSIISRGGDEVITSGLCSAPSLENQLTLEGGVGAPGAGAAQ